MNEAKFITHKENENKYLCNICSDEIEDDKIIALKCNRKKHIYCYDCIYDWYLQTHKSSHYTTKNICPICRKNGGLLPIYGDMKPMKKIHIINNVNNINNINNTINNNIKPIINMNPCKLSHECGFKFVCKPGYCLIKGKEIYGGFCGTHFKNVPQSYFKSKVSNDDDIKLGNNQNTLFFDKKSLTTKPMKKNITINPQINPNKLSYECGMSLKNKSGYCIYLGKQIYGGFCGIHKPININTNTNDTKDTKDTINNTVKDTIIGTISDQKDVLVV